MPPRARCACTCGASSRRSSSKCSVRATRVTSRTPVWVGRPRSVQCFQPPSSTARSEEHTSELQSLMRISYAVFCLKKKQTKTTHTHIHLFATNNKVYQPYNI